MLRFFISPEERKHAQKQAAALDYRRSNPYGQFPFVWTNQRGAVHRWIKLSPEENKIGAICFEPVSMEDSQLYGTVECTTDITYYPMGTTARPHIDITDRQEHEKLVACFYRELLPARSN